MNRASSPYLLCVDNRGYPASLELRKVYRRLRDAKGEALELVRIVDESGEDYLFPSRCFVPVEVPAKARRVFVTPAR